MLDELTPLSEPDRIAGFIATHTLQVSESVEVTDQTAELEEMGWREVLMTLMPFAFEEEFSADHEKFWTLFWSVLLRIRAQRRCFEAGTVPRGSDKEAELEQERIFRELGIWIEPQEYAILLILGRGLGKSATVEAAAVVRGCILGGYCLYISEAADQAAEHVGNIKILISHEDSRITEFYPHMAIDTNAVFQGKRTSNRNDLFVTIGGFVCRAKGLEAKLRGIRVGNLRPDMIILDDVDSVNDSIAVSVKKLKEITSSAIPTQARRHATILVGQNLISETGVINQIYTGQTDALAERTTIGVSNTFERFRLNHEYVTVLDEKDGRIKHKILPSAVSTWAGVRLSDAQKFLNDSGLETFLAEYMNSFAHLKNEKVFAFDEKRHLITWDAFQSMFGVRHIPGNWRAKASADLGYSKESLSAWFFAARSARNAKLPGRYFAYRSKTFMYDTIDDQAIALWKDLFPKPEIGKKHFEAAQERFKDYPDLFRVLDADPQCSKHMRQFQYNPVKDKYDLKPLTLRTIDDVSEEEKALFYVKQAKYNFRSQIQSWVISHEKTGEQRTLAQKYGIPVAKVSRFEADAGVAEANHLLRGDYTMPHPFYPDEIVPETGLYKLGSPYIFFIVRRIQAPEGDEDMKTFREQVSGQRWTQEKLTDLGISRSIPMKYKSDHCFVRGTLISTSKGQIPIEEVKQGDMLLTRKGFRRCTAAGLTNPNAEIWLLNSTNGKSLYGTSNHPVWIHGKGFTELSLTRDSDTIAICENQELFRQICLHESPFYLKAFGFTDTLIRFINTCGDITSDTLTGAACLSTWLFGKRPMAAESPRGLSFTIPITTSTITLPRILSVFPKGSIPDTINTLSPRVKKKSDWKLWRRPMPTIKNGIARQPDEIGTVSKARNIGKKGRLRRLFVRFAERRLMPIWSAENTARPSVQQNLTPFDLKLEQDTLLKPINTQNRRAVYGLTVDDAHEYFANGVLVRNCDALRMFAVDYALPESTPKTIHEEVQERIDDKYKPKEGEIVTPEQQMSYMAAKEAAEDRVKQELGLIDEEDEDGY